MLCSISGTVPQDPVVCLKSGYVYEKSLVEKAIELTGQDPVTKEPVELTDLLPVKSSPIPKPRPVASSTIPGLLASLGSEWEALMLETFQLRKTLEETRQELSQALYQHDAACRVIARLQKEKEQLRTALSSAQAALASRPASNGGGGAGSSMELDGASSSSGGAGGAASAAAATDEILTAIKDKSKELSKGRRKRVVPAETATAAEVATLSLAQTYTPHSPSQPGITALAAINLSTVGSSEAASSRAHMVLTGGADKSVLLFDTDNGSVAARIENASSKGAVTGVAFHPTRDVLYSSGSDGIVRVWANSSSSASSSSSAVATGGSYKAAHAIKPHAKEIVGLAVHPLGDYCLSVSKDAQWALSDATNGSVVAVIADELASSSSSFAYTAGALHPDGLLLAAGTSTGIVRVFDVREMKHAADLKESDESLAGSVGAVTSLAFSENGFTMASGSTDGVVRIWDLRKITMTKSMMHVSHPTAQLASSPVSALAFDFSGHWLASGGGSGSIAVWDAKNDFKQLDVAGFSAAGALPDAGKEVTGLAWTRHGRTLYATSMDRTLRVYHTSTTSSSSS